MWAPWDHEAQAEPPGPPGPRALWEGAVSPVMPDHLEQWEVAASPALLDPQDPRVTPAEKDSLDLVEWLDNGEAPVVQVCQVCRDTRDIVDSTDSLASPDTKARTERPESQVAPEPPAQ